MNGADDRPALGSHRLECRKDVQSHVGVESRRRLVEEQHARVRNYLTTHPISLQYKLARNTSAFKLTLRQQMVQEFRREAAL